MREALGLFGRILLVSTPVAFGLSVLTFQSGTLAVSFGNTQQRGVLLAAVFSLVPSSFTAFLPYVVFYCVARPRTDAAGTTYPRLTSTLVAALLASLCTAGLLIETVAGANRTYRESIARLDAESAARSLGFRWVPDAIGPVDSYREMSFSTLTTSLTGTDLFDPVSAERLSRELMTRFTVTISPIALALLGVAFRRKRPHSVTLASELILLATTLAVANLHIQLYFSDLRLQFVGIPDYWMLLTGNILATVVAGIVIVARRAWPRVGDTPVSHWGAPLALLVLEIVAALGYLARGAGRPLAYATIVALSVAAISWRYWALASRALISRVLSRPLVVAVLVVAAVVGAFLFQRRAPSADAHPNASLTSANGLMAALMDPSNEVRARALALVGDGTDVPPPLRARVAEQLLPQSVATPVALDFLAKHPLRDSSHRRALEALLTDSALSCRALAVLHVEGLAQAEHYTALATQLARGAPCPPEVLAAVAPMLGPHVEVLASAFRGRNSIFRAQVNRSAAALAWLLAGGDGPEDRNKLAELASTDIGLWESRELSLVRLLLGDAYTKHFSQHRDSSYFQDAASLVAFAQADPVAAGQWLEKVDENWFRAQERWEPLRVPALRDLLITGYRGLRDRATSKRVICEVSALLARFEPPAAELQRAAIAWHQEHSVFRGCARTILAASRPADVDIALKTVGFISDGFDCGWLPALKWLDPATSERLIEQLGPLQRSYCPSVVEIGPVGRPWRPQMLRDLSTDTGAYTDQIETTLVRMGGPINFPILAAILAPAYAEPSRTDNLRALAYVLSYGEPNMVLALRWIGRPRSLPTHMDRTAALQSIAVLRDVALLGRDFSAVREDAASKLARVPSVTTFLASDASSLRSVAADIRGLDPISAQSLEAAAAALTPNSTDLRWLALAPLLHVVIWIALLISLYPRSALVRAWFWSKNVRQLAGIGYIGLLIQTVPMLRQRLFAPYRDSLLADARREGFDPATYFTELRVGQDGAAPQNVNTAIDAVDGLYILEGGSGSGKTVFLQRLARRAARPTVYLPATSCGQGVIAAIASRIPEIAADEGYLEALVRSGALDVYVDGLNEGSQATRDQVNAFIAGFRHTNIVITTQPRVWSYPSWAKAFQMMSLEPDEVLRFLNSRFPESADYAGRCEAFVRQVFNDTLPATFAVSTILNPLDLTFAAMQLHAGREPRIQFLRKQQFEGIEEEYLMHSAGTPFPIGPFSEMVYSRKRAELEWLEPEGFQVELGLLAKHRFVFFRDNTLAGSSRCYFRHESILDFFVAHAMVRDERLVSRHAAEARYKGAYGTLALLLDAAALDRTKEVLIELMVNSGNHDTVDEFLRMCLVRRPNRPTERVLAPS